MNDIEGKELISDYFINKGWIVFDTNKKCRHDLECVKGNRRIYIELKKRPCLSTKYNDIICEDNKLEHLKQFKEAYLFNIFEDGVYFCDVNKTPYEKQKWMCQKTNNWNRNKVAKTLISFKLKDCKKLL